MKQPQFKTKQEVLRAYADLLDRHQAAGLEDLPPWKCACIVSTAHSPALPLNEAPEAYEFPVAICDGKHVWLGDTVYTADGVAIQVTEKTLHLLDEFEMFWNATPLTTTAATERVKLLAYITDGGELTYYTEGSVDLQKLHEQHGIIWRRVPSEDKEVEVLK